MASTIPHTAQQQLAQQAPDFQICNVRLLLDTCTCVNDFVFCLFFNSPTHACGVRGCIAGAHPRFGRCETLAFSRGRVGLPVPEVSFGWMMKWFR